MSAKLVDWRIETDTASDIIGDAYSMAVTADGQVVWDQATPALWLIDADGTVLRRIGRSGSPPGEYRRANDIAVARDGALFNSGALGGSQWSCALASSRCVEVAS